jgi:dihydroxy-acid dehydratase
MFDTILYGLTIGAILYLFSIGLSITFGTMHIINFAHGMIYAIGVYLFISLLPLLWGSFPLSLVAAVAVMLPLAYLVERFVIRRLYGDGIDYAIIATYAILLIGTDLIKLVWGSGPKPVSDPIGIPIQIFGTTVQTYRVVVFLCAVAVFVALRVFFSRHVIGKIVVAALKDRDGVRSLGLDVNKYFSIVFVIGSGLAVMGGVLYAPITVAEPYMGFHVLLLAFAVVIVGGMGNLTGTFFSALGLGQVIASPCPNTVPALPPTAATWPAPRAVARHRHQGWRFRQADHRRGEFVHAVRAGPRAPEGHGPARRRQIEAAGGIAKEFNTIAVDDGIAMGHGGMLYSLPSRELIADSVEYMVNAHTADAMVCISNCDKITPGMLMAALRLNIPAVFVSGGPMEAGKVKWHGEYRMVDLIDAMIEAADDKNSDADVNAMERSACPTCGSCSGMFTANSMNCLTEALGPGAARQRLAAGHPRRPREALRQGRPADRRPGEALLREERRLGAAAHDRRLQGLRERHRPRHRHGRLDQHRAAPARRGAGGRRRLHHGRHRPHVAPRALPGQGGAGDAEVPHGGRASRRRHHGHPRRARPRRPAQPRLPDGALPDAGRGARLLRREAQCRSQAHEYFRAAPAACRRRRPSRRPPLSEARPRPRQRLHPRQGARLHAGRRPGRALRQHRREGLHRQDGRRRRGILAFTGRARVCESQEEAVEKILADKIKAGDVVVVRYEGPKGGPGMQEMLYPTSYIKSKGLGKECALLTDGRFSGGTSGLSIGHASPEAAAGGAIGLIERATPSRSTFPTGASTSPWKSQSWRHGARRWKRRGPPRGSRPNASARSPPPFKAYAAMTTSADTGAVRDVKQLGER